MTSLHSFWNVFLATVSHLKTHTALATFACKAIASWCCAMMVTNDITLPSFSFAFNFQ